MQEQRFVIRQDADLSRMTACIAALAKEGPVEISAKPHKPKRSNDQNALLWAIYGDIIRIGGEAMAGWNKDDLHEFFLGSHFGWKQCALFGQKRKKPARRSSRLNKAEFSDFVEFIVRFMAEQGVYLQLPGDLQ
jgi:hypothetical protein